MKKKLVVGIVAHVDAGKTTLSEALLYQSGKITSLGRVDNQDAYLDTEELEKKRGITIFSKQAVLEWRTLQITLLDTPGHVDFSAEMERTLQVLDYAILVISGADGVQGHTRTLWRLLKQYRVPVFLFINKMDQSRPDKNRLMQELKTQLDDGCVEFCAEREESFYDQLAMCDEAMMEAYLETGEIEDRQIKTAIRERRTFPCFFGSALRLEGVETLMQAMETYAILPDYEDVFGARIFKISRDEQGNRLTHMKITGGRLRVKDLLKGQGWQEKVNQIRIYSGERFEAVAEAEAGSICAVTGINESRVGEGLGIESEGSLPVLEPVLSYRMVLPDGCDERVILARLHQLEEEEPELHIVWNEELQEIQVKIMGQVQLEVLQSRIRSRFGVEVSFDEGRIVYKETITNRVEGVGHFEPLRHYAEVHLLLEADKPGSGLHFFADCSEDILARNWQRLVLTYLQEKTHQGVLTGAAITDMKITLTAGRAHNKHTEGGDFREATYRAVRQGLKEAESLLLEPYYAFWLEVPEKMAGRAMSDIEKMQGSSALSQSNGGTVLLTGKAPVSTMQNYQKEVTAYTRGLGRLFCSPDGYGPCHNQQEVVEQSGYDSARDLANPTGSVFCANGTGFLVAWNEVKNYMHVESPLKEEGLRLQEKAEPVVRNSEEAWITVEEIDAILDKTYNANLGKKSDWKRHKSIRESYYQTFSTGSRIREKKEEYLLVDGYNIIHAWEELKEHTKDNMDGARMKLLEILSNYRGLRKCEIIVVFDAYRVEGHREEILDYHNIHMVYTREAQTADQYIEKFTQDNSKKYDIVVATSDGLEQIIVRGAGATLLSATELKLEIEAAKERMQQEYQQRKQKQGSYLMDALSEQEKQKLAEILQQEKDL